MYFVKFNMNEAHKRSIIKYIYDFVCVCALFAIDFNTRAVVKMRPTTTAHSKQKRILCSHIYIDWHSSIIWILLLLITWLISLNQIAVWNPNGRRRAFIVPAFMCFYQFIHKSTRTRTIKSHTKTRESEHTRKTYSRLTLGDAICHFQLFISLSFCRLLFFFAMVFWQIICNILPWFIITCASHPLRRPIHRHTHTHAHFLGYFRRLPNRNKKQNQTRGGSRNETCTHQYKSKQFRIIFYVNFVFSVSFWFGIGGEADAKVKFMYLFNIV